MVSGIHNLGCAKLGLTSNISHAFGMLVSFVRIRFGLKTY